MADLTRIQVGEPYPAEPPLAQSMLGRDSFGLQPPNTFLLGLQSPTERELQGVTSGSVLSVDLARVGDLVVFNVDMGAMSFECIWGPVVEALELHVEAAEELKQDRALAMFILTTVDADDDLKVLNLRTFTASRHFTRVWADTVLDLAKRPITGPELARAGSELYRRFPTKQSLRDRRLASFKTSAQAPAS